MTQDIPEKLKWYQPLKLAFRKRLLAWRVSIDEITGCVEIKRAPLIQVASIMTGLVLAAVVWGISFAAHRWFPGNEGEKMVFVGCMIILPPLTFVVHLVINATITLFNSQHWKGLLRFRFDPQNGELFFPRENMTYRQKDCQKIILGCARGWDKRGWSKMGIVYYKIGGWYSKGTGVSSNEDKPNTQIFMLILDNSGWKRHNLTHDWGYKLSNEQGSKPFMKVADCLRSFLDFDVFIKDYSLDECYGQQN